MGTRRKSEPAPDPAPSPAIDHLFDGDADPARPRGDRPRADRPADVAVDLTSGDDEEHDGNVDVLAPRRDVAGGRTRD